MKQRSKFTLILFFLIMSLFVPISILATNNDTSIFNPYFRTLRSDVNGNYLQPPIIRLGSNDVLTVSFDEISDDFSQLQYRIIHCNADWNPSQLLESEYLNGFNIDDIDDYAFSSNTFIHYVNYQLSIPNDNIQPLVSGNYLLQVFPHDDPDETILQFRFYVAEQSLNISGAATSRTDRSFNDRFQQLNFALSDPGHIVQNPYQDLIITVTKNGSSTSTKTISHPLRVQGDNIIYEYNPDLIFPASNEFRRFETVRTDYPGMHIDSVRYVSPLYNAWLAVDEPRVNLSYSYDQTQNGRFFIREYNATDSNLGADYINVHFSLDYPESRSADIYVDGDFARSMPLENRRLLFNPETLLYELTLPLKQGSYNYQYLLKMPDGSLSSSFIEGDKHETSNEYHVNVYLHIPGLRYDRLLLSTPLFNE